MWMVAPFVLFVVIALPLLAWSASRKPAAPLVEWPTPMALYVQIFIVQALIAGTAYLAVIGADLDIPWGAGFRLESVLVALGIVSITFLVAMLLSRRQGDEPNIGQAITPHTRLEGLVWLLAMAAVAFTEEFAYRGVLFTLGRRLVDEWFFCAAVSAFVFGVSHKSQGWMGVWVSAAFGLGMQVLVQHSGGLVLAMAVHFCYDTGIQLISMRRRKPKEALEVEKV